MATVIGAGKYIFSEDIPMGKYNLTAVSGSGWLNIQTAADPDPNDGDHWTQIMMGAGEYDAPEYYNLSLPKGWLFELTGGVRVEITKAKILKIE